MTPRRHTGAAPTPDAVAELVEAARALSDDCSSMVPPSRAVLSRFRAALAPFAGGAGLSSGYGGPTLSPGPYANGTVEGPATPATVYEAIRQAQERSRLRPVGGEDGSGVEGHADSRERPSGAGVNAVGRSADWLRAQGSRKPPVAEWKPPASAKPESADDSLDAPIPRTGVETAAGPAGASASLISVVDVQPGLPSSASADVDAARLTQPADPSRSGAPLAAPAPAPCTCGHEEWEHVGRGCGACYGGDDWCPCMKYVPAFDSTEQARRSGAAVE